MLAMPSQKPLPHWQFSCLRGMSLRLVTMACHVSTVCCVSVACCVSPRHVTTACGVSTVCHHSVSPCGVSAACHRGVSCHRGMSPCRVSVWCLRGVSPPPGGERRESPEPAAAPCRPRARSRSPRGSLTPANGSRAHTPALGGRRDLYLKGSFPSIFFVCGTR